MLYSLNTSVVTFLCTQKVQVITLTLTSDRFQHQEVKQQKSDTRRSFYSVAQRPKCSCVTTPDLAVGVEARPGTEACFESKQCFRLLFPILDLNLIHLHLMLNVANNIPNI